MCSDKSELWLTSVGAMTGKSLKGHLRVAGNILIWVGIWQEWRTDKFKSYWKEKFNSQTDKEHRRRIQIGRRMMNVVLNVSLIGTWEHSPSYTLFVSITVSMLYNKKYFFDNKKFLNKNKIEHHQIFNKTRKIYGASGLTGRQQWQSRGADVQH